MALPTASDNTFPKILLDMQTSTPAAPSNEDWKLFAKPDGIYARSSNSTVGPFISSAGSGMTNPLTTTGDMIYSSSGTTPARLAVGSNGQFMRTNSTPLPAWDIPPGFEFVYTERTSQVSVTATTEATADTLVTGSAYTFDGATPVFVEFYAFSIRADSTAAARNLSLYLYDGASSIGRMALYATPAANVDNKPVVVRRRLTPSNAAHTYSIRAAVNAGTGNVGAGAGGNAADMPMYIRVTRA